MVCTEFKVGNIFAPNQFKLSKSVKQLAFVISISTKEKKKSAYID